jgi:hypothetical protein
MRLTQRQFAMVAVLATFAACHKGKAPGEAASTNALSHVPGTPHTDDVLNAWRSAGLVPDGFASMQPVPYSAAYCEHGKIRGVDTVVCEYGSDQALARGTQQVKDEWARTDAHTGVILQAKRTTMVTVDRERREPSGKTISAMVKVFSKL